MAKIKEPVVTTALADEIIRIPKVLAETVRWQIGSQHPRSYRFRAHLYVDGYDDPLKLIGNAGPRSWSFVLLFLDCRLRSLDKAPKAHTNPGNGLVIPRDQVHKHRWTTEYGDREAYVPDDIDESCVDNALDSFLVESNIERRAEVLWIRGLFP